MSKYKKVRFEVSDHVAHLTLNCPDTGNAYTLEMGEELLDAWVECENREIRAILLTGEGKSFCSGFDPKNLTDHLEDSAKIMSRMTVYLHSVISTMRRLPKPIIAAVNGLASGPGFSIALASDFILAGEQATFSMSYVNLGLSPNGGATYFLTRLAGPARTAELIMTGKVISAKKALEWGIVSGVINHASLMGEAVALANYFVHGPTISLGRSKRLIEQAKTKNLEDQLEEERHRILSSVKTEDYKEGLHSLIEKRKPKFRGV